MGENRGTTNQSLSLSVSAPGKIILHGEHSVVYGKLAVAISLDLRTHTALKETNSDIVTFKSKALNLEKSFKVEDIQTNLLDPPLPLLETGSFSWRTPRLINHEKLLLRVENFLASSSGPTDGATTRQAATAALYLLTALLHKVQIKPFEISVQTHLEVGAGCGSSASFSVSLAGLFLLYSQQKNAPEIHKQSFTDEEVSCISSWSFCAEKIIHGTPSGVDNTICAHGSMLEFRRDAEVKLLKLPCRLGVLLINTKVPRNTKQLVQGVRDLHDVHPIIIGSILDAMDAISQTAVDCLRQLKDDAKGDAAIADIYKKLGLMADVNHNLLRALGVSHPFLDTICATLAEFGLHGKLTGAGGGGYAIALVPPDFDDFQQRNVIKKLHDLNFDAVYTYLGGPGIQIN